MRHKTLFLMAPPSVALGAIIPMLLLATSALASAVLAPANSRGLGFEFTVLPGHSIQAALTKATANGGATVFVQSGTYAQTTPLLVGANTHILCERGTLITATNAGWAHINLPNLGSANNVLLANVNHSSNSFADANISVEGCKFQALGTFATDGNFFHIYIRKAQHITVSDAVFFGGGDATAMLATYDTEVRSNTAINVAQCWDHFEAPVKARVFGGSCVGAKAGVLFTGTNAAGTTAGMADDLLVVGGTYALDSSVWGTGGIGIWANGLGQVGAGASRVRIVKPFIDMTNMADGPCTRVSGAGTDIDIDVTCKGGTRQAVDVSSDGDVGGFPQHYKIAAQVYDLASVQEAITMGGSNGMLHNTMLIGSSYTYIAAGTGGNVTADPFSINAANGTSGRYNLTGSRSGSPSIGLAGVLSTGGNLITGGAFSTAGASALTLTTTGVINSTLLVGSHSLAALDSPAFTGNPSSTNSVAGQMFSFTGPSGNIDWLTLGNGTGAINHGVDASGNSFSETTSAKTYALGTNNIAAITIDTDQSLIVSHLPTSAPSAHCKLWSNGGVVNLTTCP